MKGASFTWPLRADFVWDTLKSFEAFTERVADAKGSMLLYEAYDAAKTVGSAANVVGAMAAQKAVQHASDQAPHLGNRQRGGPDFFPAWSPA